MSKVGRQPIIIPAGVQLIIGDNQLKIKGPKGELSQSIPTQIKLELKDLADKRKELTVTPKRETKNGSALWGSLRALIFNMVKGVTEGFERKLEIEGVGYRASLQDNKLVLSLGFSHPIEIEAPPEIEFKVDKNIITVSGIDKQSVGQLAARIRAFRKPEPYKGKGIRYADEIVRRKAGKKAASAE
jgi:large subunit ribosomal protein L6